MNYYFKNEQRTKKTKKTYRPTHYLHERPWDTRKFLSNVATPHKIYYAFRLSHSEPNTTRISIGYSKFIYLILFTHMYTEIQRSRYRRIFFLTYALQSLAIVMLDDKKPIVNLARRFIVTLVNKNLKSAKPLGGNKKKKIQRDPRGLPQPPERAAQWLPPIALAQTQYSFPMAVKSPLLYYFQLAEFFAYLYDIIYLRCRSPTIRASSRYIRIQ